MIRQKAARSVNGRSTSCIHLHVYVCVRGLYVYVYMCRRVLYVMCV